MEDNGDDNGKDPYLKAMPDGIQAGERGFEMMRRAFAAFPVCGNSNVKAFQKSLELRWMERDPNVAAYFEGDGSDEAGRFELQFTKQEREHLEREYLAARNWDGFLGSDAGKEFDARLFVRLIEGHAASMPIFKAIEPPSQKNRQRAITSVANAFDRLVDSLNDLDSTALGWTFALVEHAMTSEATRSAFPGASYRSTVEAGEERKAIDALARVIGPAIRSAVNTLPRIERNDFEPRQHAAFFLERLMQENRLEFGVTETSFAAQCLRAMLKLAGYLDENKTETDSVSYWLKKVVATPAAEVPWYGAFRNPGG